MPATIVIGAQWGDEGKGKIANLLAQDADVVVRYQGGNNAGHTIVIDTEVFALSLVPSWSSTWCGAPAGAGGDVLSSIDSICSLISTRAALSPAGTSSTSPSALQLLRVPLIVRPSVRNTCC